MVVLSRYKVKNWNEKLIKSDNNSYVQTMHFGRFLFSFWHIFLKGRKKSLCDHPVSLSIYLSASSFSSFNCLDISAQFGKEIGASKILYIYNDYMYFWQGFWKQWRGLQIGVLFWQKGSSSWPGCICVWAAQVAHRSYQTWLWPFST